MFGSRRGVFYVYSACSEELLLELEQWLMDPVFLKDRVQVSALLAEDFREFGSSGLSYCNIAYSTFARFRMGTSGSASFKRARKSRYALFAFALSPVIAKALAIWRWASSPKGKFSAIPGWSSSFWNSAR
jgi:hypothetical protein